MEPIRLGEQSDLFLSVRRTGWLILVDIRHYREERDLEEMVPGEALVAMTPRMWSRFKKNRQTVGEACKDIFITLGRRVTFGKRKGNIFLSWRRSALYPVEAKRDILPLPPASCEAIMIAEAKVDCEIKRLLRELKAFTPRDIAAPTVIPPRPLPFRVIPQPVRCSKPKKPLTRPRNVSLWNAEVQSMLL